MASTNPTPAPGESGASGAAKKIGSSSVWVPGPALSLLLLLLLPPPLLSTGSSLHSLPVWRTFYQGTRHHRSKTGRLQTCEGAFDFYFILDTSDSVNDSWKDIYIFVDDVVKKFPNLKMRVSFITYSTQGHTLMKLTSDRNKIHNSLSRLKNIKPTGATNMHEGFKKANEQIEQENAGGNNAASLIIALTTGPLTPKAFQETKSEAEKARDMGAKVYCVGVKDYRKDQLNDIVERKDQMYGVDNGFKSLEDITNLLVVNSCHEVMAGESYFVCVGEEYAVTFYDTALDLYTEDEIVCRYKLEDNSVYDKKPIFKDDASLVCPGHIFKKPGKVVIIEYSLNNGITFVEENLKATSLNCGDPLRPKEPPKKTTTPTTTTQMTTMPTTTTRTTTMFTTTTQRTTTTRRTTRMTTTPTTTTRTTTTTTRTTTMPTTTTQTTTTTTQTTTMTMTTMQTTATTTQTTTTTMTTTWTTTTTTTTRMTTVSTVVTQETTKTTVVIPEMTVHMVVTEKPILDHSLLYPVLIPTLLIIPVVIWCICCCTNTDNEPQTPEKIETESETCIHTCTTVIVPCCSYQEDNMRRLEGKLDTLCDFVQSCNQVPLMWCQPRDEGPLCRQLLCLPPNQGCFPFNSCCSGCQHPPSIYSQPPSRIHH